MSEEKKITTADKKVMLRIWVSKDGTLSIESAIKEKEFVVNILKDSLKIAENIKEPVKMSAGQFKTMLKNRFRPKKGANN